jgi:membrane-associated phospholipid phosphatase
MTRSRRRFGYVGCSAIVLAVAFSRLYLDAHWISDVAGGLTLGLAYLLLTISLVERLAAGRLAAVVRLDSEAQVQLADDEGRRADVDPIAEPV